MNPLPRVALATLQQEADAGPMLWALVDLMRRLDQQVQIFHDESHFDVLGGSTDRAKLICGVETRYLDSWLMTSQLCRESLAHGALGSDLAILLGRYDRARPHQTLSGGALEQLCRWLDIPQIAIVDTTLWDDCEIPRKPEGVSAVLLDRVKSQIESHWRVQIESLWGVPVLGMLPELKRLRQSFDHPPATDSVPCQLCNLLGSQLSKTLRWETLLQLSQQAGRLDAEPRIFRSGNKLAGLRVAVAYDEVFDGYYPEVLELLELQGAEVADFSPLRDQALPQGTDVVYCGCGNPQRFAAPLAENHCMKLALQDHVRHGKRIYAEGGGAAYLSQQIVNCSASWPMVGLLPVVAHFQPGEREPAARELTLLRNHWLGLAGDKLRGYDSRQWRWESSGESDESLALTEGDSMLISSQGVVGSTVSLNFAAQPKFLENFSSSSSHALHTIS